jgi:uncharacterized protein YxjI
MLFKQRFFSWFDSYDIYNSSEEVIFTVKGRFAWEKKLEIYDAAQRHIDTLEQRVFQFMPTYDLYLNDRFAGTIYKRFSFFRPIFDIDCNGWHIEGNWAEWDYKIFDSEGTQIAYISKELFNWTDTYVLDVYDPSNAVTVLMIALAIDADKASRD